MDQTRLPEEKISIRLDKSAVGQPCALCEQVDADYQPEVFVETEWGWRFICKLCAWDHVPWLVSIVNLGHYNDWDSWGGKPPMPDDLVSAGMTMADLLGEQVAHGNLENPADSKCPEDDGAGADKQRLACVVEDRRVRKRYEAHLPVVVKVEAADSKLKVFNAFTRDMGPDSIFLETDRILPEGSRVSLHMEYPGSSKVVLKGTVARTEQDGMAVTFNNAGWDGVKTSISQLEQAVSGLARAFGRKK